MARKSRLTRVAVGIGTAIGKADRKAHQVAKAGLMARQELVETVAEDDKAVEAGVAVGVAGAFPPRRVAKRISCLEVARPGGLGVPLGRMREYARKSFWSAYEWLMPPAPSVAGLGAYTRMQKYAWDCYRTSSEWLWAPIAGVQAYRSR